MQSVGCQQLKRCNLKNCCRRRKVKRCFRTFFMYNDRFYFFYVLPKYFIYHFIIQADNDNFENALLLPHTIFYSVFTHLISSCLRVQKVEANRRLRNGIYGLKSWDDECWQKNALHEDHLPFFLIMLTYLQAFIE